VEPGRKTKSERSEAFSKEGFKRNLDLRKRGACVANRPRLRMTLGKRYGDGAPRDRGSQLQCRAQHQATTWSGGNEG